MQTTRFHQRGGGGSGSGGSGGHAAGDFPLSMTIGTNGAGIPLRDLSRFLELLRAAYVRCLWATMSDSAEPPADDPDIYRRVAEVALASGPSLRGYTLDAVASSNLAQHRDLLLFDIRRENPLELMLGGVGVALAAAVIISGGEVKIGLKGIHFKVNSLGDGIKKIRAAFSTKSLPPRSGRKALPPPRSDA